MIRNYLTTGHEQAICIDELQRRTNLNNREVRKAIETACKDGVLIGNMQDGKGYFIFDLPRELSLAERYLNQEYSRAMKILQRISKLDGLVTALKGGNAFRIERKMMGLTQNQVSKATGIKKSRISKIELGKVEPTIAEKIELCKLFKTSGRYEC